MKSLLSDKEKCCEKSHKARADAAVEDAIPDKRPGSHRDLRKGRSEAGRCQGKPVWAEGIAGAKADTRWVSEAGQRVWQRCRE